MITSGSRPGRSQQLTHALPHAIVKLVPTTCLLPLGVGALKKN